MEINATAVNPQPGTWYSIYVRGSSQTAYIPLSEMRDLDEACVWQIGEAVKASYETRFPTDGPYTIEVQSISITIGQTFTPPS